MSVDERVRINSLPASADYTTTGQYLGVEINSSGKAVLASTLGQAGNGILYNKPNTDQAAEVAVAGVAKCVYGASVTAGAKLTVMASGKFQTAGTGHHVWGKARISGSTNDIGEIDLDDTKPILA